jgi:hypothetical protein
MVRCATVRTALSYTATVAFAQVGIRAVRGLLLFCPYAGATTPRWQETYGESRTETPAGGWMLRRRIFAVPPVSWPDDFNWVLVYALTVKVDPTEFKP